MKLFVGRVYSSKNCICFRFWFFKFAAAIAIIIGAFFIPEGTFTTVWFYVGMAGALLFHPHSTSLTY
jgi:hypothetical protein